jgi:hypothetical protein
MSARARGYLVVATLHFGLIGASILLDPSMYGAAAFVPMVEFTGLTIWGVAYAVTGLLCGLAAVTHWPTFARVGLTFAFVVLISSAALVGLGVAGSWLDDDPTTTASPIIPISFAALAIKDLLMVEQPLRTPAEDYEEALARLERS